VNLAGFKGCMFCCNTRINKVYWQYKVRCCKDCLYHKTIGEWEFEKYLDKQHYEHLPYMMRNTPQFYIWFLYNIFLLERKY